MLSTPTMILQKAAASAMAAFPQYEGMFERFRLCRVKVAVHTKLGTAFVKDELAIYDTQPDLRNDFTNTRTLWSVHNKCLTVVKRGKVELLEV